MKKNESSFLNNTDIAVIGMSGMFPGAKNINNFWENLISGTESITRFSKEEISVENLIKPELLHNPHYIRAKGHLEEADFFGANFFGINEKKAKIIDPQFRLFLECVWQACQDAGYDPKKIQSRVGVYASSSTLGSYYYENLLSNKDFFYEADPYELLISNAKDFMASFVAYNLDFQGPCLNIQTACSSSLVAICKACDDLLSGQCDMAVAGGMSVTFPLKEGYLYKPGMIYSQDGYCKPFSAEATGIVGGNGGGAVLLKLLSQAEKDNDHVYAVIKGYAVNNDGRNKLSYTAPSIDGQYNVLLSAAKKAGIDPSKIEYIEAHGTGTRLGDQIEIAAIKKFLSSGTDRESACLIGSVKSNIGHLDVAAGVAGFIKAVLAVSTRIIPASLHSEKVNPDLVEDSLIKIASQKTLQKGVNFYAGVSSFGVGGTNAHIVLGAVSNKESSKIVSTAIIPNRRSYYIPPHFSQNTHIAKAKPDLVSINTMLSVPVWEQSNSGNISPIDIKNCIIVQDETDNTNDFFNYFLNENIEAKINLLPFFHLSNEAIDEEKLSQRIVAWQNSLNKYNDQSSLTIIKLSFSHPDKLESSQLMLSHFYDFIALARALSKLNWSQSINLIIIGNGFANVNSDEVLLPSTNLLLGPLMCLPIEYPFLQMRGIDMPFNSSSIELLSCVQQELNTEDSERLVAYRKSIRYIRIAKEIAALNQHSKPIVLKKKGVYLISGGLGGIGLVLAEHLAVDYQANLILVSQSPFPNESDWPKLLENEEQDSKLCQQLLKLIRIKKHANRVLIFSADIADKSIMSKVINEAIRQLGSINGIIHTASAYPQGLTRDKKISDINLMFRSKIVGLNVLEDLMGQQELDFMLLCSALNIYQGAAGAIDYVAANAYMNAWAQKKSENVNYPVIAVSWDAWKEVGMHLQKSKLSTNNKVERTINLDEEKWKMLILEHQLNKKFLVPGAMLLDILVGYLFSLKDKPFPIELCNLAFMSKAELISNEDNLLKISLKENEITVIKNSFVKSNKILQANFHLTAIKEKNNNFIIFDKISFFKKLSNISHESYYEDQKTIKLGSHWECLKWVKFQQDEYLAFVSLPEQFSSEISDYILHPALLDMAFSFPTHFFKGQYLPYYMKSFLVYSRLPEKFYSLIKIKKNQTEKGMLVFHVILVDEADNILVEIEEFILKKMVSE